jgi:uncharacterized protein YpmS
MKTHLLALILLTASWASAQTVAVISPDNVTVDGKSAGTAINFVATNPQFAAVVQTGLATWQAAQATALQDAVSKQAAAEQKLAAMISSTKDALAQITAAKVEEAKTGEGPRFQVLADNEQLLAPIISTAEQDALAKQRAEKQAQIDALQAELDQLDAS